MFGLARNSRLEAALTDELAQAKQLCMSSGQARAGIPRLPISHAQELEPDTSRGRQGRAHTPDGSKSTLCRHLAQTHSCRLGDARALYEDLYCARGEAENRIGEQFEMFADRASSATMPANQLRMSFSAMAYVLVDTLRRVGLRHSHLPTHRSRPFASSSSSSALRFAPACVAFISPSPPDAPTRLSSRSRTSIFGARLAPPESYLRSVGC